MDLTDSINVTIKQSLEVFATRIIEKFGINCSKDDLLNLWYNKSTPDFDMKKILLASKQELIAECKKRSLKVSGSKATLISRLTGKETTTRKKTPPSLKQTDNKKIINKIKALNQQTIQIRKNSFGNYEHCDTRFVFDKNTQKVIGIQNEDGTINPLSPSNIDLCNKYKFSYTINVTAKKESDSEIEELNSDFSEEDYFSE